MKIVSNLFHMKHTISEPHSQRQRHVFESIRDTRKKEQWHFCKLCVLIANDLESSLFLKQTFSKSLMAYSSIHLLHCKFFEVQVACNITLQQLMKFLNLSCSFMPFWMVKKGNHLEFSIQTVFTDIFIFLSINTRIKCFNTKLLNAIQLHLKNYQDDGSKK